MIFHEFSRFFFWFLGLMVVSTIIRFEQNLYFQNFWQKKWFYRGPNEKILKKSIFFHPETSKWNLTHFRPLPLPKIFQILVANFISFHLRYSTWTCLNAYFCYQLLNAGGQKLIFWKFFLKYDPSMKFLLFFLHHTIGNVYLQRNIGKNFFSCWHLAASSNIRKISFFQSFFVIWHRKKFFSSKFIIGLKWYTST